MSLLLPAVLPAQEGAAGLPAVRAVRAAGPIDVDGKLGDAGWQGVAPETTFFETNRSDSGPPPAATTAWLAYDDRFFYAAFEFTDPEPGRIRAPVADRDNLPSDTDYGGVILGTGEDGKTALMFLANPRGIQYDAVSSDVSGEDSSPDLFWDAAGRITATGWVLEIRVPFSSLRYDEGGAPVWRVLLYRNYPRDFRYQMFSSRLPRGSNCFVCHSRELVGLAGLPAGGNLVVAPYATAERSSAPRGEIGSPLEDGPVEEDGGLDLKWTPNANTALDLTLNPDFSQVESDVALISTNERFALFVPEKRPFFLERLDLLATPLQVVYTRNLTSPRWGGRATGTFGGTFGGTPAGGGAGGTSYTVLVAEDRGGGSVILPGPTSSRLAPQDFESRVLIGRMRRDLGRSFASLVATAREIDGGGYSRLLGPDFQWRPNDADTFTGQLLWSDTETPNRPGLAAEWDGRRLTSHAADLQWTRSKRTYDTYVEVKEIGDEFRADLGFLPQVGYREALWNFGRPVYPEGRALSRIRPYFNGRYATDTGGDFLLSRFGPAVELEGFRDLYADLAYKFERVLAGSATFERQYLTYYVQLSPSRVVGRLQLDGFVGEDVDFANGRAGRGAQVNLQSTLRPTDHLELVWNGSRRWLDLRGGPDSGKRLFTSEVARLKATYAFTSRAFLRLVGQLVRERRDPALYGFQVERRNEDFAGSALFAYKLNWQTLIFLGYGDERTLGPQPDPRREASLEPARRELFLKISYAFQR
ncbi:MAG TPA: DUF5916 domain-containing protein [Thermoanaerobaculia bacterium]|nr:DUF5916 domain-containing protein [Thermoanaerobaculia bacterium]